MCQTINGQKAAPGTGRGIVTALFRRVLRHLMLLLFVFLGITVISFTVIHLAPGSPVDLETTMNPLADKDARECLQKLYGLD
jgi:peptide/nickel transport system permease protein